MNNFLIQYNNLIKFAQSQNRKKLSKDDKNYKFYHAHHIVPVSINSQLKNDLNNIVLLTLQEHYLAHYLLFKGHPEDGRYAVAFWMISHNHKDFLTPLEYEKLKEEECNYLSALHSGEGNPMYGKNAYENKTEEEMIIIGKKIKEKLSGKKKGKRIKNNKTGEFSYTLEDVPPDGWQFGSWEYSEESKEKMSISAKKRGAPICAFRDKTGKNNPMYGKKQTEHSKRKQSETKKLKKLENNYYGVNNKKWYNNGKEEKYFIEGHQPSGWKLGRIKFKKNKKKWG